MEVDRNGLQVLEREECLQLLGTATLGRIGVSSGALPVVLPVNFYLDGDRILVRSSAGTKLDAALQDTVVAFEVDDFDAMYHAGWSVLVTGVAHVVDEAERVRALQRLPLVRWAPASDEDHVVSISTEMVSGRRLVPSGNGNAPVQDRAPLRAR